MIKSPCSPEYCPNGFSAGNSFTGALDSQLSSEKHFPTPRHFCGILSIYYVERSKPVMDLAVDEVLVERIVADGDGRALETLFRRHMDRVYRLARRYFNAREDAEEIVSESFLRCFKALGEGQFRGDSTFRTWLVRITVNVCLERLRQPRLPTLLLEQVTHLAAPDGASSGELAAALSAMPDDQRLAIVLCDLEGYEAKEAAAIIGRTVTATKSLHYRGRRTLRDILTKGRTDDGL